MMVFAQKWKKICRGIVYFTVLCDHPCLASLLFAVLVSLHPVTFGQQGKDTTIQEGTMAAELAVQYLQRQRTDESFTAFYTRVVDSAKELISPPVLPRYRQPPQRLDGGSSAHQFSTPECYFSILKCWT